MADPRRVGVSVEGLSGLRRAFRAASEFESKALIKSLSDAAEPVRSSAEGLALGTLRHGRIPWHEMRKGVTLRSAYVAPKQRRTTGTPRKQMGTRLLETAMIPALDRHQSETERAVDEMLGRVGRVWETVP